MLTLSIVQAGILGIQSGDNPRILEMKLAAFLDPRRRARLSAENA
jgi:flagellar motor component MotA